MNCFTHALPSLDDAYLAAGCCIPDWLAAADRKCRVRQKKTAPYVTHEDPIVASIAQGIVNHHRDDHWFHTNLTFQELNINFSVEMRKVLGEGNGMRNSFFAHVLIELFLDAWLHQRFPGKLEFYYEQLASIDPDKVEQTVNLFASRPTEKLSLAIRGVIKERYLFDYVDDERTLYRINRVLKRIGLAEVDRQILPWVGEARQRVYDHVPDLLDQYSKKL